MFEAATVQVPPWFGNVCAWDGEIEVAMRIREGIKIA
jgi:hypothetical protein